MLSSCGIKNSSNESEDKKEENSNAMVDSVFKIVMDNGFEIVGGDVETYRKYGVFTSLNIERNGKPIFQQKEMDEFKLEKLNAILIPNKNRNQFELIYETFSYPSKPVNNKLTIFNDTVVSTERLPSFETVAKNLDSDSNLELAGYWSDFELWGDKELFTSYNPILFYEVTENGLQIDTPLTVEKNEYIYGKFLGYDFSEELPQQKVTMERHSVIIEEIKNK